MGAGGSYCGLCSGKSRLLYELKRRLAFPLAQREGESSTVGIREKANWFHCPADEARRRALYPFRYFLRAYFEQDLPKQTLSQKKARFAQRLAALIAGTPDPGLQFDLKRGESFLGALIDLHWPDSLYEQVEPQLRHENSLDALKTLFLAESQIQPVIIELEDAHWLDEESTRFLRYLTRPVNGNPLVVIAACRQPLPDDWLERQTPSQTIQLSTLTTNQMRQLAEVQLAAPVSFTLAELVTDRANGNPFFAEQLLRYLQDQNLLAPGESGLVSTVTNGRIPTNIQAVLVAYLDRLLPDIKDIVQKAAVLGQEFDLPVLALMCSTTPGVEQKVQAAVREAIWLSLTATHYLFRHALMRDAAYEMQLRARLRELHRLAGQALEQTFADNLIPYYAELAHHYRQAEDIEKERHYVFLAGEQAAAQFANTRAEAYFSRALELTPPTDDANRYDLHLHREAVYNLQGNRDAQRQDLIALEALADKLADRSKRAEAALRWANYAETIDDYPTAITKVQQAIKLAEGQALHFEAEGYFLWGVALYKQSRNEAAHPRLEQALTLTRKANLPNTPRR